MGGIGLDQLPVNIAAHLLVRREGVGVHRLHDPNQKHCSDQSRLHNCGWEQILETAASLAGLLLSFQPQPLSLATTRETGSALVQAKRYGNSKIGRHDRGRTRGVSRGQTVRLVGVWRDYS